MTKKITDLWAWVAEDGQGAQGIPVARGPRGALMPLVGSNRAAMEAIQHIAEEVVRTEPDAKAHLCHFKLEEVTLTLTSENVPKEG